MVTEAPDASTAAICAVRTKCCPRALRSGPAHTPATVRSKDDRCAFLHRCERVHEALLRVTHFRCLHDFIDVHALESRREVLRRVAGAPAFLGEGDRGNRIYELHVPAHIDEEKHTDHLLNERSRGYGRGHCVVLEDSIWYVPRI